MRQNSLRLLLGNAPLIGLTFLSLAIVVYLAYRSASVHPPTVGEATALAVLAGLFQVWAAILGSSKGRADPNFVRGAVMRLGKIGLKAGAAEQIAQAAFEQETVHSRRVALGQLSVILSFLQGETADAIRDWDNLYPDMLKDLSREVGDSQGSVSSSQEAQNA
jgi:hypothetical protein